MKVMKDDDNGRVVRDEVPRQRVLQSARVLLSHNRIKQASTRIEAIG